MKVYEQIFAENKSSLQRIKDLQEKRERLFEEGSKPEAYLPDIYKEISETYEEENIENVP